MSPDDHPLTRALPAFLKDGVAPVADLAGVTPPEIGRYPTDAQIAAYPKDAARALLAINVTLQSDLNQSIAREADLREALCHAVVAMESAQHTSVMMARGELDSYDRTPSHIGIQNVLQLTLFHINETTGINARSGS